MELISEVKPHGAHLFLRGRDGWDLLRATANEQFGEQVAPAAAEFDSTPTWVEEVFVHDHQGFEVFRFHGSLQVHGAARTGAVFVKPAPGHDCGGDERVAGSNWLIRGIVNLQHLPIV
jgi:hypothetical protein